MIASAVNAGVQAVNGGIGFHSIASSSTNEIRSAFEDQYEERVRERWNHNPFNSTVLLLFLLLKYLCTPLLQSNKAIAPSRWSVDPTIGRH